jgi:hypothetical protein
MKAGWLGPVNRTAYDSASARNLYMTGDTPVESSSAFARAGAPPFPRSLREGGDFRRESLS